MPSEKVPYSVAGLLMFVGTCLVQVILWRATAQFAELFKGFGVELPLLTKLFVEWHISYLILPLLALTAVLFYPLNNKRSFNVLLFCIIVSALMLPIAMVAMYLPVFK